MVIKISNITEQPRNVKITTNEEHKLTKDILEFLHSMDLDAEVYSNRDKDFVY